MIDMLKELIGKTRTMNDFRKNEAVFSKPWLKKYYVEQMNMSDGHIKIHIELDMKYYYAMLSELVGAPVSGSMNFTG